MAIHPESAPRSFAIASFDEVWLRGALVESRLSHGIAQQSGDEIVATDARDDALVRAGNETMQALRETIVRIGDARVRAVVRAMRDGERESVEATMTIATGEVSIVTTPGHALDDYAALRELVASRPAGDAPAKAMPILWRNGSAAVLLHEAAGHAAEHHAPPVAWPAWLSVRDEGTEAANLLVGEPPRSLRRTSFRDVPLPRMTNVVARQSGAPFDLPNERIEVHLVAGGAYDPLTEIVRIRVGVADLVQRNRKMRIAPFEISGPRATVAAALTGAGGDPIRYPGVICSREGQELYVGSHAPLMITAPWA